MHTFLKLFIIGLLLFLYTGCSQTSQSKVNVATEVTTPKPKVFTPTPMFLKVDVPPFKRGKRVTVIDANSTHAEVLQLGSLPLNKLEIERSSFQLFVKTAPTSQVQILNIQQKYHDHIWLPKDRYFIKVSKAGFHTFKQWVHLDKDKNITITLKREALQANGTIHYKAEESLFSVGQDIYTLVKPVEKMRWKAAVTRCQALKEQLYGIQLSNFTLPTASQLLQISKSSYLQNQEATVFWTATVDEKQKGYAKYVNINSGESSWYKKEGKTYVICREALEVNTEASLDQIAKAFSKQNVVATNKAMLNYYKLALFVKYGTPQLGDIYYDVTLKELHFDLISQHKDNKGMPLFKKHISLPMEKDHAAKLLQKAAIKKIQVVLEFKVTNSKIKFVTAHLE